MLHFTLISSRASWLEPSVKTAIYNSFLIYESYIYHVDINYSTITSFCITPAIHPCQWAKQTPTPPLKNRKSRLNHASRCLCSCFQETLKEVKAKRVPFLTYQHVVNDDAAIYCALFCGIFWEESIKTGINSLRGVTGVNLGQTHSSKTQENVEIPNIFIVYLNVISWEKQQRLKKKKTTNLWLDTNFGPKPTDGSIKKTTMSSTL